MPTLLYPNSLDNVLQNFLIEQWTLSIFIFYIFSQKWHLRNFFYQNACSTYLFKHLLQQLRNLRLELAPFFVMRETNDAREPPEKVIKVPFKTNNSFNSTMMASFLPVIVSKKNKQTEKNMSFIAVYHKFT